jgi:hypothetical protein
MFGTCTAYWWNPLTGVLSSSIGTFDNSLASQSFTTPSASGRADSSNDWMLVCKVPTKVDRPVPLGVSGTWTLVFQDEFNGTSVNESYWQILDPGKTWGPISSDPAVGGTADVSAYDNTADFGNCTWDEDQISVSGSLLTLNQALISGTQYGGAIVSRWPLHHGYYEARLKFTSGWPAWWFAWHGNSSNATDNDFDGTEMDVAEAPVWEGHQNYMACNVHTGGYAGNHTEAGSQTYATDGDWHVVGLHWTTTFLRFYCDGVLVREITNTLYIAQDPGVEYMILNNASPGSGNGTAQWDYVRHWTGG